MSLHHMLRAAAGSAGPSDPYFEYNTLLLTGDGTNGAQNNTFLDSSTNNFTITRNGNTTQGTFSPYGNLWSNYFDGSGDYLSVADNAALQMRSGDFTVEFWVCNTGTGSPVFYRKGGYGSASNGFEFYSDGAGQELTFLYGYGTTGNSTWFFFRTTGATTWSDGKYHHIAIVRNSGTITIYFDGVVKGSATVTMDFVSTESALIGGRTGGSYFNGYISNVRIVKGTAVYTSNFTPSTTPLTAVSGTSLLTCQSNRFKDNSSNNFAITVNGNTSVQRFSQFNPTAPYSAATIGGSGYFDGTGDYLTLTGSAPGSGDFTWSGWIYCTSLPNSQNAIFSFGTADNSNASVAVIYINSSGTFAFYNYPSSITSTGTINLNSWNYLTVTRSSGTVNLYMNSVLDGSGTKNTNISNTSIQLGRGFGGILNSPICYLSDVRLIIGSANAPSSNPTSPLTAITNTSLLCNFTNAGIPDAAMMNDLETVGNAQVSTSVKKYGTGSLYFDGTGDYLTSNTATSDLYAFGSGDFTIEMWIYLPTTQSTFIYDSRPTSTQGVYPSLYLQSNAVIYYVSSANRIVGSTLSNSTWHHIALCRSGTSTKLFINGTQSGSTYTDTNVYLNGSLRPTIASSGFTLNTDILNGYIDDLRITKGLARYTANFTPPAQALPTY